MILAVDWVGVAKGLAAHRPPNAQALSDAIFGALIADPENLRRAQDAVNDFTRIRMREDGFFRRIMPPLAISDADLDRAVDTDRPVRIVDVSPEEALRGSQEANRADAGEPAGISIPFATLPRTLFIRGPRYTVNFALPDTAPSTPVHSVSSMEELQRLINEGGPDDRPDPAEGERGDPGPLPPADGGVLQPGRPAGDR